MFTNQTNSERKMFGPHGTDNTNLGAKTSHSPVSSSYSNAPSPSTLNDTIRRLTNTNRILTDKVSELEQRLKDASDRKIDFTEEIFQQSEEMRREIAFYREENQKLLDINSQLTHRLSQSESFMQGSQIIHEVIEYHESHNQADEQEISSLRSEINRLQSQINSVKSMLEEKTKLWNNEEFLNSTYPVRNIRSSFTDETKRWIAEKLDVMTAGFFSMRNRLVSEIQSLRKEKESISEQVVDKQMVDSLTKQQESLLERIYSLEQLNEKLTSELHRDDNLEQQIADLEFERDTLQNRIEELRNEKTAGLESSSKAINELTTQIENLEKEREDIHSQISQANKATYQIAQLISGSEVRETHDVIISLRNLHRLVSDYVRNSQKKSQLETADMLEELRIENDALQKRLDLNKSKLSDLTLKNEDLRTEIEEVRSELQEKTMEVARAKKQNSLASKKLEIENEDLREEIRGSVNYIMRTMLLVCENVEISDEDKQNLELLCGTLHQEVQKLIKTFNLRYEEKLVEIREERKRGEELRNLVSHSDTNYENDMRKYKMERDELKEELLKAQSASEQEIKRIKKQYDEEIHILKSKNEELLSNLQKSSEELEYLKNMTEEESVTYSIINEELERNIDSLRAQLSQLQNERDEELNRTRIENIEEIQRYRKLNEELRKEKERVEEEIQRLNSGMEDNLRENIEKNSQKIAEEYDLLVKVLVGEWSLKLDRIISFTGIENTSVTSTDQSAEEVDEKLRILEQILSQREEKIYKLKREIEQLQACMDGVSSILKKQCDECNEGKGDIPHFAKEIYSKEEWKLVSEILEDIELNKQILSGNNELNQSFSEDNTNVSKIKYYTLKLRVSETCLALINTKKANDELISQMANMSADNTFKPSHQDETTISFETSEVKHLRVENEELLKQVEQNEGLRQQFDEALLLVRAIALTVDPDNNDLDEEDEEDPVNISKISPLKLSFSIDEELEDRRISKPKVESLKNILEQLQILVRKYAVRFRKEKVQLEKQLNGQIQMNKMLQLQLDNAKAAMENAVSDKNSVSEFALLAHQNELDVKNQQIQALNKTRVKLEITIKQLKGKVQQLEQNEKKAKNNSSLRASLNNPLDTSSDSLLKTYVQELKTQLREKDNEIQYYINELEQRR